VGACAHRLGDATSGSALDCDLVRREDVRHGGRARPGLCSRDHRCSVTAGTGRLAGAGLRRWRWRRARRAPTRRSATWPPPWSRTVALLLPRFGPGGGARFNHAFPLDGPASLLASGPPARRWRAEGAPLKNVKEVVTTRADGWCAVPLDALHIGFA
jgi:hypothetical protein